MNILVNLSVCKLWSNRCCFSPPVLHKARFVHCRREMTFLSIYLLIQQTAGGFCSSLCWDNTLLMCSADLSLFSLLKKASKRSMTSPYSHTTQDPLHSAIHLPRQHRAPSHTHSHWCQNNDVVKLHASLFSRQMVLYSCVSLLCPHSFSLNLFRLWMSAACQEASYRAGVPARARSRGRS